MVGRDAELLTLRGSSRPHPIRPEQARDVGAVPRFLTMPCSPQYRSFDVDRPSIGALRAETSCSEKRCLRLRPLGRQLGETASPRRFLSLPSTRYGLVIIRPKYGI